MTFNAIAVVGSGAMGRGIAQLFLQSGCQVTLFDTQASALTAATQYLSSTFETLVSKGKLDAASAQAAMKRLQTASTIEALAGSELVIEAIVENLAAKQALFKQLEPIVGEACVLATNTSSLSVTAIAAQCVVPQRVAGLHFFNPVPLMKVVEVIRATKTDLHIIERLITAIAATGHMAVSCSDTPGFVINHAGRGYGTEALKILGEGVIAAKVPEPDRFAVIDDIMREQVCFKGLGFRLGPFELLDLTALDVSHPVMEAIYRQYFEEPRFRPSGITATRLAGGLLGKKTGAGFYSYAAGVTKPSTNAVEQLSSATSIPKIVWVGPGLRRVNVVQLIESFGITVEQTAAPSADALIIVLPEGHDCTSAALQLGVSPSRTVALDTLFDLGAGATVRRVIMSNPATEATWAQQAVKLFGYDQAKVTLIADSAGFVAPRIVAMVIAIACEMAQAGIARAKDIDRAVQLGLGYPVGPLSMGEEIGSLRVLGLLENLFETTKDPRYRPSLWLSRRARLGLSLLAD